MATKKFYRTDLEIPTRPQQMTGIGGQMKFVRKTVYGRDRVYLTDKVQAAALYDLTGLKTLLPMHMNALEAIGFSFVLDEEAQLE